MSQHMPADAPRCAWNAEYAWDEFDPDAYVEHTYRQFRADDRQIVEAVRDFFAVNGPEGASGIDVGTGPSLIPTLAMLPFCEHITLLEHAASNLRWLEREVRHFGANWDPVWDELCAAPRYRRIVDPRLAVAAVAAPCAGSVFDLPERRWGIGTMFFVAESFSRMPVEFERAVTGFVGALQPGAPFALACMEGSTGYSVAGRAFPAVPISAADLERVLAGRAEALTLHPIGLTEPPLRAGYTGMVLATGRVKAEVPT